MAGIKWFLKIGEVSDMGVRNLISNGFELLDCQYGFYHGMDESGKAQTNTRLDGIHIVYDGLPSSDIIKWAMDSRCYYNGALVLYDVDNMPVEKLFFEDGACSSMRISYIAEGNSYATTRLTLYPRVVKIDDNTFRQPWTISEVSNYTQKEKATQIGKISQPIGKTNARLRIEADTYELTEFEMNFVQQVDYKGQPAGDITGGVMTCVIDTLPSRDIKKWALSTDQLRAGEVEFYQELQNSPLKVAFSEAYCVEMMPFRHSNGEIRTRLIISANEVDLNGKSLFKNWKL